MADGDVIFIVPMSAARVRAVGGDEALNQAMAIANARMLALGIKQLASQTADISVKNDSGGGITATFVYHRQTPAAAPGQGTGGGPIPPPIIVLVPPAP